MKNGGAGGNSPTPLTVNPNGSALLLVPDNWHVGSLQFYTGSAYRRDLHSYDALSFKIKSFDALSPNITFNINTWDFSSNTVQLSNYSQRMNGSDWYQVQIPTSVLRTDEVRCDAFGLHCIAVFSAVVSSIAVAAG